MRVGRSRRGWRTLAAAVAAAWVVAAPQVALAESDPDRSEVGITNDPWEGMNRGIFRFNETLDRYLLEPVATGWDFVFPDLVQTSIRNVTNNLRFPIIFVNNVLQLKPEAAAQDVARFVVNSTVGIAGVWDPARRIGLEANDEDFGQTLGYWGVPPGPYLVLPFFGPSSPRDALGLAGDVGVVYGSWFAVGIPIYVTAAITAVDVVNRRSLLLEEIREEREAAFDFYVFVRNAYIQNRARRVADEAEKAPDSEEEDLYYLDEEDEEEGDLYYPDETPEESMDDE
jgi:phospholipid-binding lipoprotein MlaA